MCNYKTFFKTSERGEVALIDCFRHSEGLPNNLGHASYFLSVTHKGFPPSGICPTAASQSPRQMRTYFKEIFGRGFFLNE